MTTSASPETMARDVPRARSSNQVVVKAMIWVISGEAWQKGTNIGLYSLLRPWAAQVASAKEDVERMLTIPPIRSPYSGLDTTLKNSNAAVILPNGHLANGASEPELIRKLFSLSEQGLARVESLVTYELVPGGAQVRSKQSGPYDASSSRADWAVLYTIEADRSLTNDITVRFMVVASVRNPDGKPFTEAWYENFVGTDRTTRAFGAIPCPPSKEDLTAGKTWPSVIFTYSVAPPHRSATLANVFGAAHGTAEINSVPPPAYSAIEAPSQVGVGSLSSATPSFTTNTPLSVARRYHTATLLTNGQVLICGGLDDHHSETASVEIYDFITSTWRRKDMRSARYMHTATLLANGQVMVAGGNTNRYRGMVEVYDPGTGVWTIMNDMNIPRRGHTATLLPNGTVLVAGGANALTAGVLSAAEIYDPMTDQWIEIASMINKRSYHTATPLRNGKVLVAGGSDMGTAVDTAELFDPATRKWKYVGALTDARYFHTATQLPDDTVMVTGGSANGVFLSSVEIFDPRTSTWKTTGSLNTPRGNHSATLLPGGSVLVAGGYYYDGIARYLSSGELRVPGAETWQPTSPLITGRQEHTATLLSSGTVLIVGGSGTLGQLASTEIFCLMGRDRSSQ